MNSINREMIHIATVTARHTNTSVFFLFQSLFPLPTNLSRQISLNAKYLHVFKSIRDSASFSYLARQLIPGNSHWLIEAFLHATQKPYSCLLIDLTQGIDDRLRYRGEVEIERGVLRIPVYINGSQV